MVGRIIKIIWELSKFIRELYEEEIIEDYNCPGKCREGICFLFKRWVNFEVKKGRYGYFMIDATMKPRYNMTSRVDMKENV